MSSNKFKCPFCEYDMKKWLNGSYICTNLVCGHKQDREEHLIICPECKHKYLKKSDTPIMDMTEYYCHNCTNIFEDFWRNPDGVIFNGNKKYKKEFELVKL